MPETSIQQETQSTWVICRDPVLLTMVGGAIDTIGFIALFGFFTAHVTGNLVLAGAALVKGGAGLWIKLAAIPLFIVTVVITKLLLTVVRPNTKRCLIYFYLKLFFSLLLWLLGFTLSHLKMPIRLRLQSLVASV
nr:YoaK family protein [Acinetobacter baumannii]